MLHLLPSSSADTIVVSMTLASQVHLFVWPAFLPNVLRASLHSAWMPDVSWDSGQVSASQEGQ